MVPLADVVRPSRQTENSFVILQEVTNKKKKNEVTFEISRGNGSESRPGAFERISATAQS
jgi:hypothetical protein